MNLRTLKVMTASALIALAASVPLASQATNPCNHDTIIFGRPSVTAEGQTVGTSSANVNALTCVADSTGARHDGRYLMPGSNQVSIRYSSGSPEGTSVFAVLNGLGHSNSTVEVPFIVDPNDGTSRYQSGWVNVSGTGSITASVYDKRIVNGVETMVFLDSTTYRTVN